MVPSAALTATLRKGPSTGIAPGEPAVTDETTVAEGAADQTHAATIQSPTAERRASPVGSMARLVPIGTPTVLAGGAVAFAPGNRR